MASVSPLSFIHNLLQPSEMGNVINCLACQPSIDRSQKLKTRAVDCYGVRSRKHVAEMRFPAAVTQLLSIDECLYCIDYEDIERFEQRRFGDAFVQIQAASVQAHAFCRSNQSKLVLHGSCQRANRSAFLAFVYLTISRIFTSPKENLRVSSARV